jgi:glycine oxidase
MHPDFLIVGGGVIGLSVARELLRRKLGSVAVVDKGLIGSEASSAAAGMLAAQAESDKGGQFLDLCIESRGMYPELSDALKDETGIDIGLERSGTFYLAFNKEDSLEIRKRFEWQKDAGLKVELLSRDQVLSEEKTLNPELLEGLSFPDDWQVENRKLIMALRESIARRGTDLLEGSEVVGISSSKSGLKVTTRGSSHQAGSVIVCAGAWTTGIMKEGALPTVRPVKGQILEYVSDRESIPRRVIYSPRGYVVPRHDGRIVAGSTMEDVGFDKTPTAGGAEQIQIKSSEILPLLQTMRPSAHYAGLRPMGEKQVPFIGQSENERILVATGHFRNGILLAPVTAKRIADLIESRGGL